MGLFKGIKQRALGGMLILVIGAAMNLAQANSMPFAHVYAFGDSLTDTGRFYALSGGVAPAAPNWQGRYSNGEVWIEQLMPMLGMPYVPEDNYAVGGATTGRLNYRNGVAGRTYPGILAEVDQFRQEHTPTEAEESLFILWGGANDFFVALATGMPPQTLIQNGVGNTVQAIRTLWLGGARHIMVVNVPDLGVTPFALGYGLGGQLSALGAAYNLVLDDALDQLAAAGIPTIRMDSFAVLHSMATDPDAYGFTNVTYPASSGGVDSAKSLFWDPVHPTTLGHQYMAEAALDTLVDYYSPGRGTALPDARANALKGLVHASPAARN
jgi:outer membrane lipase/esterase